MSFPPIEIDFDRIAKLAPTPSYVVDLGALRRNLAILDEVQQRSGAKILLALKGFAMWSTFDLIGESLHGVCASSPWEARLGREEFAKSSKGEVHSFATAMKESDVRELIQTSNHLLFNSFTQLERFRPLWQESGVSIGLRVNPEHSEGETEIYDPCAPGSRLGIRPAEFDSKDLKGVEGLHFHTLCEQLFAPLERTAKVFEAQFGHLLPQMKWLNLGGGHHITREGYDIDGLVRLIKHFKNRYDLDVYLEPGEAIALNTGVLVAEVLDIVENERQIAILDSSVSCHMPDVLEMPYRPEIVDGGKPGERQCDYRLAGPSCLAGDVIGDWSFDRPLKVGQKLVFLDMAHYTMVKNTTFNGIQLPHICTYEPETDELKVVRSFHYEDFRDRLS